MAATNIRKSKANGSTETAVPVDFVFDCHGPLSFCMAMTPRAEIHARNFFSPRGTRWLGTWLFPPEDAEVILRRLQALGTYRIRLDGNPLPPN